MAIAVLSCAQKNAASEQEVALEKSNEELVSVSKDLYSDGRSKMVKTAECRFQVSDMRKTKDAITSSIKKYNGYIESSNLEFQNPMLEEHMTVRVLNDFFEDLLNEITSQATYVNYQKVNSDDVSKQFVDLESRLKTKREVQARYEDILRKKTGTLEELLKTEKQIGELQEEIEATVSQINFLSEKVRYSTIKLEIYQIAEQHVAEVKTTTGSWKKFSTAFAAGWNGFTNVLIGITYLWPFFILSAGAWYFFWLKRKKKTMKPTL
jgi:Lon protease-like protein